MKIVNWWREVILGVNHGPEYGRTGGDTDEAVGEVCEWASEDGQSDFFILSISLWRFGSLSTRVAPKAALTELPSHFGDGNQCACLYALVEWSETLLLDLIFRHSKMDVSFEYCGGLDSSEES